MLYICFIADWNTGRGTDVDCVAKTPTQTEHRNTIES